MTRRSRALVIGAAGQDGSYLTELLLDRGYEVLGVVRRDPSGHIPNLAGVRERIDLVQADLRDTPAITAALKAFGPHEVYNFASVSFGPHAWEDPARTAELGTVAVARLLEALRAYDGGVRFLQASSSWVFGRPEMSPQDETTRYAPCEPYGAAKAYGNFLVAAMRQHYGLYACSPILYNHESPRRPERFVTRKVTRAAARIRAGLQDELVLGDIDARRDWSYAKDMVEGMWRMLQHDAARDFVLASGELHSVRELIEIAFGHLGLTWADHVRFDDSLRRADVAELVGDPRAAREQLGWRPTLTFREVVELMVDADVADMES